MLTSEASQSLNMFLVTTWPEMFDVLQATQA